MIIIQSREQRHVTPYPWAPITNAGNAHAYLLTDLRTNVYVLFIVYTTLDLLNF